MSLFRKKKAVDAPYVPAEPVQLPIPTHLQPYLVPAGYLDDEHRVIGTIRCTCGGTRFAITESNERSIVRLTCPDCGKEILLFDAGKHGWDGFVDEMDLLDRDEPFQPYLCPLCGKPHFAVAVYIENPGKAYFWKEAVSQCGDFSLEDWVDAFDGIAVSLTCTKCCYKNEAWLEQDKDYDN